MAKSVISLKQTRKCYAIEYVCGGFLLVLPGFAYLQGMVLPKILVYLVGGLGIGMLGIAEGARFLTRYKIMDDKLVIIKGVIKQAKKSIYFHPLGFVPDINVHQSRLQRLLNYGTVFIKEGGGNALEIKNVNKPHGILKILEDRIESNRTVTAMHQQEEPFIHS